MDEPDVYNVCLSDFIIGPGSFSCAQAHAILSQFPCFPTYIFLFEFPSLFFLVTNFLLFMLLCGMNLVNRAKFLSRDWYP
jgi:hypothetical protein